MTTPAAARTSSARETNVSVADVTGWYRPCMSTHKLHILRIIHNLAMELASFVEIWSICPEDDNTEDRIREMDDFYLDVISNVNRFLDLILGDSDEESPEDEADFVLPTKRLEKAEFKLSNPISQSNLQTVSSQKNKRAAYPKGISPVVPAQGRNSQLVPQRSQPMHRSSRTKHTSSFPAASIAGPSGTKHGVDCPCQSCQTAEALETVEVTQALVPNDAHEALRVQPGSSRSRVAFSSSSQPETPEHDLPAHTPEPPRLPALRPKSRRLEKVREEGERGHSSGSGSIRTEERDVIAGVDPGELAPGKSDGKGKGKSKDMTTRASRSTAGKTNAKTLSNDETDPQDTSKKRSIPTKTKRALEEVEKEPILGLGKRQSKRRKVN